MMETLARPLARPAVRLDGVSPAWLKSRYFTLVLFTLVFPFVCLAGRPLIGDVWWLMASARVLVQQGALPTADPFTFAPHTSLYVDAQWLAQLGYYGAYRALGLEGVSLFNAAVGTLGFGLLLLQAWRRGASAAALVMANLATILTAMWYLHPRAQTLAFVTFAATAWLLTNRRPGVKTVLGLAGIEAVWVNLHGSFFLGPVVTLACLAGDAADLVLVGEWRAAVRSSRLRMLAVAALAQVAASLLNPYGPGIYLYALRLSSDPSIRNFITEWAPTAAHDWSDIEFFVSVALTGTVLALARRRVAMRDLLLLVLFAALGLQANRNIPWWALASGPILAQYLSSVRFPAWLSPLGRALTPRREAVRGNLVRAGLIGLIVVAAMPGSRAANPLLPASYRGLVSPLYPLPAFEFLAQHPYGGHIFAHHPWGSYIDWALWPTSRAMIDPAIELHPASVWEDALALNAGNVFWQELLDRYGVDVLLLSKDNQAPLIQAVEHSPRWQQVYDDPDAVIYVPASLGTPPR